MTTIELLIALAIVLAVVAAGVGLAARRKAEAAKRLTINIWDLTVLSGIFLVGYLVFRAVGGA